MTVKDSFQIPGMNTTSGAPQLSAFIPEEDARLVARLRQAGAIIFGKTNLPIYAGDLQSYNEVFGTTNNPHDVWGARRVDHPVARLRPWHADLHLSNWAAMAGIRFVYRHRCPAWSVTSQAMGLFSPMGRFNE